MMQGVHAKRLMHSLIPAFSLKEKESSPLPPGEGQGEGANTHSSIHAQAAH